MSTLVKDAQNYIERVMRELSGDDDFMPFLTMRNAAGEVAFIGMMMPDGAELKNDVAETMVALCMMYRPVEVAFATVAWMVMLPGGSASDAEKVTPSEHPDRVETVFITAHTTEGNTGFTSANVIRENNMVGVGVWEDFKSGQLAGGRFGNAIQLGIELGAKIPPEMCAWLDEQIAAGEAQNVILMLKNAVSKAYATAAKIAAASRN